MCLYALLMGRLLESPFGIVAFAWAFIAWAAFRNHLADAQAMAISMTVILFAAALALGAVSSDHAIVVAHLSLALAPAAVAFSCVTFYVAHIRRPRGDEPLVDWTSAVATAAAAKVGRRSAPMPPTIVVGQNGPQIQAGSNDVNPTKAINQNEKPVTDEQAA